MSAQPTPAQAPAARMSRRQVLEALSGLLLAMFCSMVSTTVVGTSLPIIVPALGGTQESYTWVVTITLLTTAISTPIWGKLADLVNRKTLMLIALAVFVLASAGAGMSTSAEMLIAFRALQGLGGGGLAALSQVLMADIISPRERGKYMGLFAGVMAVATVGGPLLGGVMTDTIGWRWNFYVGVPLGIIAFAVLLRTLRIEQVRAAKVRIDYLGIVLLSVSAGVLLVWITNVSDYGWISWETAWMVGIALIAAVAFVLVELRVAEPLIPLTLFRNRTFTLAVLASISIGVAMFGTSVYLGQYMQISRGYGPTEAGLLTIPMAAGMLVASAVVGQLVTRFGRWKSYLVVGAVLMIAGTGLLSTLAYDTSLWLVGTYMFLLGAGTGMTMQNLVLVVQNTSKPQEIGVASSGVNFFRTVGGTAGVAVMGSVLAASMTQQLTDRAQEIGAAVMSLGEQGQAILAQLQSGALPVTRDMPEAIAVIIEDASAQAISHAFLIGVPLAILSLVAIAFLPNKPLTRQNNIERMRAQRLEGDLAVATAETGSIPVHVADDGDASSARSR
ncbi:MDR family MFS transporter [Microbacterium barkeri]|uniref:MDR family MFS transporter n=1 Tax=Microbacterium barkeri TaxID=33917 RepID=UPI0024AED148|nr:MDR family MFS transporter [Microbacterium barkeri]MDI6943920.1 MDR family MFS transporter [Microbacterium barkeri]